MKENNNIEKTIDETVMEMKQKIAEISKESAVEETSIKEKIELVAQKSIVVINAAIEKLIELAKDVKDSDELKNTLEFVSSKTKDITDVTIIKLKEIKNSKQVKQTTEVIADNLNKGISIASNKVSEGYSFVKEKAQEGYKNLEKTKTFTEISNTVSEVKKSGIEAVNDFMNKPEVSSKIEKAKDVTIELAEKALDALRNWLKPEDKGKTNND